MKKVSIIVPIYNVEKYIERCAVSLFEQDFNDIEYVFVNDCTPDDSVVILQKVIEKYPNRKPNIKIIHHKENKGLGGARKTGLEDAVGDYILHIDSDDWVELNMVSELYTKAKETDADIVACDYFLSYKDKDIYKKQDYTENTEKDIWNLWIGVLRPYVWNKLIKRNLYIDYAIYPSIEISIIEDFWLMTRLFSVAKKIAYVAKAFLHYWQNNINALTKNMNEKYFRELEWLIKSTEKFLKEEGLYKKYIEAFNTKKLAYVLWFNNGQYDRKLINSICPNANKLKYIDQQPNWSPNKKGKIKTEYINQMPAFKSLTLKIYWRSKKLSKRLLQFTFLGLSSLLPRNKNIWIFGGHHGHFTDNTKYLFIYVAVHCPNIRAIWISENKKIVKFLQDKGFEAYCQRSLKGIFYALRGKFYIFHSHLFDINFSTGGGTTKVNLWHGAPIKRIRFSTTQKGKIAPNFVPSLKNKILYPYFYIDSDYILSTSKRVSCYFSEAFRVQPKQCMEFGYPRNEILSYSEDNIMDFIEKYEPTETKALLQKIKAYKKVFVYMPTWRDNGRDFIQHAGIDFGVLSRVLKNKNYFLILKLHRYTKLSINLKQYENVYLLDSHLDIYPILPFTNCLITDYSSVYFDYHLMDKEVILFPFDKKEYIDKDREMYFDYNEVTENELVVNSFDELVEVIKTDKKSSGVKNNLVKEMILETKGIKSSQEIIKFLTK